MSELWGLLALAALVGLVAGWLIWGGRQKVVADKGRVEELRLQLTRCQTMHDDKDARMSILERELEEARTAAEAKPVARLFSAPITETEPEHGLDEAQKPFISEVSADTVETEEEDTSVRFFPAEEETAEVAVEEDTPEPVEAEPEVAAFVPKPEAAPAEVDYDGDGVIEGTAEGRRPAALSQPRSSGADDLKRIKGIGPKLEILCNSLGFYHFDQIAKWSPDEVAWVDANLKGFKGRVTRDEWVSQAALLADGGETQFSRKVDEGDVYT
ncbi:MAG: hypothetical protein AAF813_12575 [Pseudomonadota bacterium]